MCLGAGYSLPVAVHMAVGPVDFGSWHRHTEAAAAYHKKAAAVVLAVVLDSHIPQPEEVILGIAGLQVVVHPVLSSHLLQTRTLAQHMLVSFWPQLLALPQLAVARRILRSGLQDLAAHLHVVVVDLPSWPWMCARVNAMYSYFLFPKLPSILCAYAQTCEFPATERYSCLMEYVEVLPQMQIRVLGVIWRGIKTLAASHAHDNSRKPLAKVR